MARPAFTMTEQAAWHTTPDGIVRAFEMPDGGRWLVTVRQDGPELQPLSPAEDGLKLDVVLPFDVPALGGALAGLGPVARFRNPNLWDALGTAIIRQVIRAAQATKLYRAFCVAYREQVTDVPCELFPAPETVLGLSDEQFASIGMTFKRRPLRAAAEAYLESGDKWRQLDPEVLVDELQTVPRIGPWTAGAAVADWSNDFALYPYADLAVRTWARRAAPDHPWPDDEVSFARRWRELAGERLSDLTLLTLAWGSHHGDTG
jgi:DNA-3-methyladenine glycosylase II